MSAYSAAVLADSPDVYYRLDETGLGPFVDVVGAHNATPDGVIVSGASLIATDPDASAVFDPATTLTRAVTSYALSQQPLTVEFWIRPASLTASSGGSSTCVSCLNAAANQGWECAYADTTGVWRYFLATRASYAFPSAIKAQIGVTQHVVFVNTATTTELFINGATQGSQASLGIVGTSTLVIAGSNISGNTMRPKATIDEVAIYKAALSAGQILAHYTAATVTPLSGGLELLSLMGVG